MEMAWRFGISHVMYTLRGFFMEKSLQIITFPRINDNNNNNNSNNNKDKSK